MLFYDTFTLCEDQYAFRRKMKNNNLHAIIQLSVLNNLLMGSEMGMSRGRIGGGCFDQIFKLEITRKNHFTKEPFEMSNLSTTMNQNMNHFRTSFHPKVIRYASPISTPKFRSPERYTKTRNPSSSSYPHVYPHVIFLAQKTAEKTTHTRLHKYCFHPNLSTTK